MTVTRGHAHLEWNLGDGFRLPTARLDLVPADSELLFASWQDPLEFARLLRADVPEGWPPPIVEDPNSSDGAGWWNWYFVKRPVVSERPLLIGIGGFKGWPMISHTLQMGCAFMPQYQRQGYGMEAIDAIASWALSQSGVNRLVAEVPEGHTASIKILTRTGFVLVDRDPEEGLVRYERCTPQTEEASG